MWYYELFHNFITKSQYVHLNIEGTLEPEMFFKLAKRNNIKLKEKSVKELKSSYKFNNLQYFLDIYNIRSKILIKKRDFYDS